LIDNREGTLKSYRTTLATLVYPVEFIVNLPFQIKDWVSNLFISKETLSNENNKLKEELLLIKTRLQQYEIIEAENHRLRSLLESSFRLKNKVLIAELVAVQLDSFRKKIVINKGENDGGYLGQPVLDATGIIGQITQINPFSSTVLLITDPNHALPVQINRNGLRAIAVGSGENNALLLQHLPRPLITDSNLPNNAHIMEGDLVVTSGLGRRFPRDYPVGEIRAIIQEPGESSARVIIKPFAEFNQIREVLMVWPNEYKNND
jgi:rod shape-determining protein MreC